MDFVTLMDMGKFEIILAHYIQRKTIIKIQCKCGDIREIRIEALYRQQKRGNTRYICPSCASKKGWTKSSKLLASNRTKQQWEDPQFSGVIIGKAVAKEIIKQVNKSC